MAQDKFVFGAHTYQSYDTKLDDKERNFGIKMDALFL